MPKGGRRPGSGNPNWVKGVPRAEQNTGGRPPGRKNRTRSYHVVKKAYESGEPVPLEVMLDLMRYFHKKAGREETEADSEAALKEAGMWAQASAPYMHPRLAAIAAQTGPNAGDTLSALLQAIDGTTTGITNGSDTGESPLEIEQSLHLPN
jgi:hypothetical protein